MIKQNIETIKKYVSGDKAFANVKEIINFHRVQASPGYREAADYCLNYLGRWGLDAHILEYKAEDNVRYWQQRMFKEWNCTEAALSLTWPERCMLADFHENPMSVIQRSLPADFTHEPLDIVWLDRGSDAGNYEDIDVRGKIIFVNDDYTKYMDWIYEGGAVGIITDHMPTMSIIRDRHDLCDATNNVSFKWNGTDMPEKLFGFVLTPRLGDKLKSVCSKVREDYKAGKSQRKYPQATGYMDSELRDGTIEDVEAVIRGETDEEIIISAHLCHPRSCANDNASGASAAMEAVRGINEGIKNGLLKRPKRTIRLLLIPEFTGVYAYLSQREAELGKMMAAINLDMVGGSQDEIYGPLIVMSQPDACPSFVKDAAMYILDEIKREMQMLALGDYVSTFTSASVRFSSGSDHSIFADPTVGIPCLALTQWPDKTYHTSQDTLDKIDPEMLRRSALLSAAYVYTLANLSVEDLSCIMNRARQSYGEVLSFLYGKFVNKEYDTAKTVEMVEYNHELFCKSCEDYLRFFEGDELDAVKDMVRDEIRWASELTESFGKLGGWDCESQPGIQNENEKYSAVPRRLFRGPLIATGFEKGLGDDVRKEYDQLKKKYSGFGSMDTSIIYWCDGSRSIWDISRKIACEKGLDSAEYVDAYLTLLKEAGLIAIEGR